MTTTAKAKTTKAKPAAKMRLRREIVDAMQGLCKVGAVSDAELKNSKLRMLGRNAQL